jgi:recombination protein RecR
MAGLIAPVARLIEAFNRLPGVGPKTAQRLTYHVLRSPTDEARALAEALIAAKEQVAYCSTCWNITDVEVDPCVICADPQRDATRICVVEEPLDVLAIERTREFRGRYHVLHGAISPMDGIGPERIRARELVARANGGGLEEVILATNPTLEGEATAMYLADLLGNTVPAITRIARGVPVGGDLEYADDVTLIRSLQGRRQVERSS